MNDVSRSSHPIPRRSSTACSVSLRHDDRQTLQYWKNEEDNAQVVAVPRQSSDDTNNSDGSIGLNVERWFDRSNKHPAIPSISRAGKSHQKSITV